MSWAKRRTRRGERVALRLLEQAGRQCGECQACCEVLGIEGTESPAGERCRHQCAAGCALHGTPAQPAECRYFGCAWRWGMPGGGEELRPDRCGLMLLPPMAAPGGGPPRWEAVEVRPFALATPEALHCLRTANRVHDCPGVVVLYGTAGRGPGGTSAVWPAADILQRARAAAADGVSDTEFLAAMRGHLVWAYGTSGGG